MGVPTSEVGYIIATTSRETKKVHTNMWWHWRRIILLQTTRNENNWKTEETLERAVVTLETERIKGSNPWCLWWWWSSDLSVSRKGTVKFALNVATCCTELYLALLYIHVLPVFRDEDVLLCVDSCRLFAVDGSHRWALLWLSEWHSGTHRQFLRAGANFISLFIEAEWSARGVWRMW